VLASTRPQATGSTRAKSPGSIQPRTSPAIRIWARRAERGSNFPIIHRRTDHDPLRAFGNVCSAALKERFLRLDEVELRTARS
jgi:hypothetical protein